ncbi:oxygen-dependent tRNA uridine(34) hydroxylase TrhO [Chitinophaga deserti]|uniref:oxygen-dependent tRNA uridine(34) hydroxylase TrhO n=1 Tax=Chitinophaga deserti TaxID=2164099 RepID=UPI000D6D7050|nr:rhodanese-related sulfurtransferase [Chitinophaga deserti]
MVLHNRFSATELKARLAAETFRRVTVSFYQYAKISDPKLFRDELYTALHEIEVFGRIYVAHEGINAQISIPEHHFDAFRQHLDTIPFLKGIRLNVAVDDNGKSFWVLKIKVREKIVADGITDSTFDMDNRGKYLNAREFNELSADPDTVIIDMRNHYEFEVGHFDNALEVPSDTFREQLPMAVDMMKDNKDKNIIMYCTGGIRCEKASAYMLHHGFNNVFHLEGGIIEYSNKAREWGIPNKFRGKNFVFDDRLGERITEEIISQCHQCGAPCDTHVNCANEGCHLLFIQCEKCAEQFNKCCSQACTDVIALPEEEQAEMRKGIDKGLMLFNKRKKRRTAPPGESAL